MALTPARKAVMRRKLRQFDRRKASKRYRADLHLRRQQLALRRRCRKLKTGRRRTDAMLFWCERCCRAPAPSEE